MQNPDSQTILKKIRKIIRYEEIAQEGEKYDEKELVEQYLIPSLESNKDIQRALYSPKFEKSGGLINKFKSFILRKIGNVATNVVEKSFLRQQKFNNSLKLIVEYLVKENKELRERVKSLEDDEKK